MRSAQELGRAAAASTSAQLPHAHCQLRAVPARLRPAGNGMRARLPRRVASTPFEDAKAMAEAEREFVRVPGLAEFASSVWERRQRIPSSVFRDPLQRLFEEFDADGDGHLTAEEVAAALQSRGVELTAEVAQRYIDAVDLNDNRQVEANEFSALIFKMAAADMRGEMPRPKTSPLKRSGSLRQLHVFQVVLEKDPSLLHIPGLQQFAASVWDRRRHIPAHVYHDPLERTFKEFDEDGDGHLTPTELVAALAANGVEMSQEQAELVMAAVDTDGNGTIELEEFPGLIYGLATLDRLSMAAAGGSGGSGGAGGGGGPSTQDAPTGRYFEGAGFGA